MTKQNEKAEWERVAEAYEASGLTQRAYAAQRGMPLGTLQTWVYRRRRQQRAASGGPPRLLPVQVAAAFPGVERPGGGLEVHTASGVRVCFAAGTDVEYVARLVAALKERAC